MSNEVEEYGDSGIESYDKKIPGWLKFVYFSLPFWGILWLYLYWDGSHGWLDRGYWGDLQRAANTTFNQEYPKDL
jgi:hypothetical protein